MKNQFLKRLVPNKMIAGYVALAVFFVACEQTITEPVDITGKIMFYNASTQLSRMLDAGNGGGLSYVLIDDAQPGLIDTGNPETSRANPVFKSAIGGGQAIFYYPYTSNALTDQYWIRYMQLDEGEHRYRLLDTAQNAKVLVDTLLILYNRKPMSVFFSDSATVKFSAVAIEHEEKVVPDKARIRMVNLMPDANGGGVVVKVGGQAALTDSLGYLGSTPYQEYPIPQGERLYMNIYYKNDTVNPVLQNSVTVKAGHSYLLVTKGYTKEVTIYSPEGERINIPANPRLDIINTY